MAPAAAVPVAAVNVLNISKGYDTGGTGYRLFDAFRRLEPGWSWRSMYAPNGFTYIDYPIDLSWDAELAKRLYREADVIHLHNGLATARIFERMVKPKPVVIHYHGSALRANPRAHLEQQRRRGAIGLVSTLDLHLISPGELEWLPSPYQLEWLASIPTNTGSTADPT